MRQAGRYMAEFRAYSDKYPFRMRSETPDIAIELSMQVRRRRSSSSSSGGLCTQYSAGAFGRCHSAFVRQSWGRVVQAGAQPAEEYPCSGQPTLSKPQLA
jgi:hypothetical protein